MNGNSIEDMVRWSFNLSEIYDFKRKGENILQIKKIDLIGAVENNLLRNYYNLFS